MGSYFFTVKASWFPSTGTKDACRSLSNLVKERFASRNDQFGIFILSADNQRRRESTFLSVIVLRFYLWNSNISIICMNLLESRPLAVSPASRWNQSKLFQLDSVVALFFYFSSNQSSFFPLIFPRFIRCFLYFPLPSFFSLCLLLISQSTELNMETPNQSGHDMVIIFKCWFFFLNSLSPSLFLSLSPSLPFSSFVLLLPSTPSLFLFCPPPY